VALPSLLFVVAYACDDARRIVYCDSATGLCALLGMTTKERTRAQSISSRKGSLLTRMHTPSSSFSLANGNSPILQDVIIPDSPALRRIWDALPDANELEAAAWLQPLILCTAAAKGELAKIREFVEKGFDPKGSDYDGRTPLHLACEEGHLEVVKYLVSVGADINCADRWGTTPIRGALAAHHRDIFSYLKEHGAVMGFANPKQAPGVAALKVAEKTEQLQSMFAALSPANKSISKLTIPVKTMNQYLKEQGIYPKKHKEIAQKIKAVTNSSSGEIAFSAYTKLINEPDSTLARAFKGSLVISNWKSFVKDVTEIFEACKSFDHGKAADYIPELAEADVNKWSVSIMTVDGQTLNLGDTDIDFSMQSCGKPLLYSFTGESVGLKKIHEYVGSEPSGVAFNSFTLNAQKKPHNPFINAGAILTSALFYPELVLAKRFKKLTEQLTSLAGGERIGFNQSVYLSEKSVAHRNYALAHFMESEGGFPSADLMDTVDFYFQMCSCEANTAGMASMAATYANNGKSPLTKRTLLSSNIVKNTLQLMYSCGMYDYSGEWACTAGIPAKSGVSGCVFAVIPGVMGIATYSPNLDSHGNSIRGMEFCRQLVSKFGWNLFDILYNNKEG